MVRLVDDPVCGDGRHYVIERELTTMAELDAIVTDYLEQARLWDVIPADRIVLRCWPSAGRHER